MKYVFDTDKRVCSDTIEVEIDEDGKIEDVSFRGGCRFNGCWVRLRKEAAGSAGKDPKEIIEKFSGRLCGHKGTSCEDQLAEALKSVLQ